MSVFPTPIISYQVEIEEKEKLYLLKHYPKKVKRNSGNWLSVDKSVLEKNELSLLKEKLVYCINDALKNKNGTLKIQFMDFYGNVNWSKTLNINLLSNSSQLVYSINKLDFNTSLFRTHLLSAQFTEGSQNESIQSLFYFEKPKNLVLLKPTFAIINLSLNSFSIKSDFLAKNVSLSTNPNLSDNYFDLLPGEEKIIYLSEPPKNSDFKNSLIIKSLFDVK